MTSNPSPLAAVLRIRRLPGWIRKFLEVPPERSGVTITRSGVGRTYPAGRHKIVGFFGRLTGRGVGLRIGIVPAEPFSAVLPAGGLLSGDGELLEARLYLNVRAADPVRFFQEVVIPLGEIAPGQLTLEDEAGASAFRALARKYRADDLAGERLNARLISEWMAALKTYLDQVGLESQGSEMLVVWPASDEVSIAEKRARVQAQLDEIELDRRMSAVQNKAQLQEFIDQFGDELGLSIALRAHGDGGTGRLEQVKDRLTAVILNLLTEETDGQTGQRRWRFLRLFDREEREKIVHQMFPILRRAPRYWWLPRTLLSFIVAFLLLMGTWLITWLASGASWLDQLDFLLPFWGFMVPLLLASLYKLYQLREEIEERSWTLPGYTQIDNLVRNNRPRADKLVRQECARELNLMRDTLNDLRSRVYKGGDEEGALRIRRLEQKLDDTVKRKILAPDFGKAPYVTDLKITRKAWDNMLDHDEQLLLYASALSEKAALVQQNFPNGDLQAEMDELETELDRFVQQFAGRARPLKPPEKKNEKNK